MAKPVDLEEKRAAERRLALLALAGTLPESSGSCLDAEELAALVEGKLAPGQIEACLAHLAGCEHCYTTWQQLDQDWQLRTRPPLRKRLRLLLSRPRFLATAGSLLAAAASIAVFLNITMHADRQTLMRPPAQSSQEQALTAPTTEAADQAQPEKGIPAPAPPASMAPKALEQQAAAPLAQPVERSKKKARPHRVEPREQEALKPAQPPALAPKPEINAMQSPAVAEPERVVRDMMMEKKEQTTQDGNRANDSIPIAPQAAMQSAVKAAVPQPAPIAGTASLTLAVWHNHIRAGCQGEPGPAFFDEITKQGQQLLQQSASLQKSERRQIERIIAMLADRQPAELQCRALLELLGPVAPSRKP
ncbi:MAG: hypothetical protein JZU50_00505 [Desulfobulbaceae bacterium]|nr:hypothetical protein [Desulfobulbaceae bacterium]